MSSASSQTPRWAYGAGLLVFVLLLLAPMIAAMAADPTPAAPANNDREPLISISKAAREGSFDVEVRNAPFQDVVRAIAKAGGINILFKADVPNRMIQRAHLRGVGALEGLQLLANAYDLIVTQKGDHWEVSLAPSGGGPGSVTCYVRVFVVESASLDAMLEGRATPTERLRFPEHVLVFRGPLLPDLLRLWVHDEAATVSEPHVVAAAGQSAAVALMSVGPAGKPVAPSRVLGGVESATVSTYATLRPKIKGDGSIEMALSLRTCWSPPMPHVVTPGNKPALMPGAADAFAMTIDIPAIGLRSDQQLIVRGWDISGGRLVQSPDNKWETLLVVTARPN